MSHCCAQQEEWYKTTWLKASGVWVTGGPSPHFLKTTKAFPVSNADFTVNVPWCVLSGSNTLLYCCWGFCRGDGGGGGGQKGSRRRQMNIRVFMFHLLRHSTYGSMQSEDKDAGLLAGKERRWQLLKLFHPLWLSFRVPLWILSEFPQDTPISPSFHQLIFHMSGDSRTNITLRQKNNYCTNNQKTIGHLMNFQGNNVSGLLMSI